MSRRFLLKCVPMCFCVGVAALSFSGCGSAPLTNGNEQNSQIGEGGGVRVLPGGPQADGDIGTLPGSGQDSGVGTLPGSNDDGGVGALPGSNDDGGIPDGGIEMHDGGVCRMICPAGEADCDHWDGNGCETNLNDDNANCGACNHVCDAASSCQNGQCVPLIQ